MKDAAGGRRQPHRRRRRETWRWATGHVNAARTCWQAYGSLHEHACAEPKARSRSARAPRSGVAASNPRWTKTLRRHTSAMSPCKRCSRADGADRSPRVASSFIEARSTCSRTPRVRHSAVSSRTATSMQRRTALEPAGSAECARASEQPPPARARARRDCRELHRVGRHRCAGGRAVRALGTVMTCTWPRTPRRRGRRVCACRRQTITNICATPGAARRLAHGARRVAPAEQVRDAARASLAVLTAIEREQPSRRYAPPLDARGSGMPAASPDWLRRAGTAARDRGGRGDTAGDVTCQRTARGQGTLMAEAGGEAGARTDWWRCNRIAHRHPTPGWRVSGQAESWETTAPVGADRRPRPRPARRGGAGVVASHESDPWSR